MGRWQVRKARQDDPAFRAAMITARQAARMPVPQWQEHVVERMQEGATFRQACRLIGISEHIAYRVRARDSQFAAAVDSAQQAAHQQWKEQLLLAMAAGYSIVSACARIGVTQDWVKRELQGDAVFAAAWQTAYDAGVVARRTTPPPTPRSQRPTDTEVAAIRERYRAGGIFLRVLAAEYGMTVSAMSRIVRGQRHKGTKRA